MADLVATVLYEDSAPATPTNYGYHGLVLACVADRTGRERWSLAAVVVGRPMRGAGKLKKELEDKADLLMAGGAAVIALFDRDKVGSVFQLPNNATNEQVIAKAQKKIAAGVRIVLLDRNLETVLDACCRALDLARPTGKLRPSDSDAVFHKAAAADARVREEVLREVPSFESLVNEVIQALEDRRAKPR